MPLDVIQRIMGHRSLHTTESYARAETRTMVQQVEMLYGLEKPGENAITNAPRHVEPCRRRHPRIHHEFACHAHVTFAAIE
jgi:hypothetical protein